MEKAISSVGKLVRWIFYLWVTGVCIGYILVTVGNYSAKKEVPAAFDRADEIANPIFNKYIDFLRDNNIVSDQIALSKSDICTINSNHMGIISIDHRQECYIRYVAGFETDIPREHVAESLPQVMFGKVRSGHIADCHIARNGLPSEPLVGISLFYRTANLKLSELDGYPCGIPEQINEHGNSRSSFKFESFVPETIGNDSNQVWFTIDVQYYDDYIGCGAFWFPYCSEPRSKPVHPRAELPQL